ncbi:DUF1508 domain-containing protein [Streptomyces sp. NBC_00620]|uniref:DUF1508 domain-containing protein n=1 Tax=unclassified Streptomyces TaxID=2593676 RepID=UPI002257BB98|nr:DUF1508 domain-containing protein [Streptomyces sp. NBC_00620]MCX4971859.1 DUF1508 domain-containing protein [Streptomyces sp. NBC_00620]WUC13633.1 DUF1508 domain-containing protein [Streptomyces sp. NBC_00564]WUC49861.1 DUF1508 domain-containing protein [Streptomyces sp. NBC_00554]
MAARQGGAAVPGTRCQIDIGADGSYLWRLTATNGRVIAVAAMTYRSYGECRTAFEQLCADVGELPGGVHHTSEGNGWVWRLRDRSGGAVAVSSRAYERHSTCQAAYDRFRALLSELGSGGLIPWDDLD